jgi:hypothetical protein
LQTRGFFQLYELFLALQKKTVDELSHSNIKNQLDEKILHKKFN